MEYNRSNVQSRTRSTTFDAGLRDHMSRVYNRMTIGLMITAVISAVVSSSPTLLNLFLGGPQAYIIMFAPLAVIWFGFNPQRMSSQKLMLAFTGVAVLYGISLSTLAIAFTGEAIAKAFFVSAGMFAAVSIFGYTTKKDLAPMGQFLFMGIIGVLLLSVVSMFTGGFGSQINFIINLVTVGLFAGVTAYETQMTKEAYNASYGDEANSRMAWGSALSLYISFIAIFVNMLQLMQQR